MSNPENKHILAHQRIYYSVVADSQLVEPEEFAMQWLSESRILRKEGPDLTQKPSLTF